MKKVYLCVFGGPLISHEKIRKAIDKRPEIVNWHTYFDRMFLVVSESSASDLADIFRDFDGMGEGTAAKCMIVDTSKEVNGWMPKEAWDLVQNPMTADEEKEFRAKKAKNANPR